MDRTVLEQKVSEALKIRPTSKIEFLDELMSIDEEHPNDGMLLHLIAHTLWELKQYKKAIITALRLISGNPTDASASLILFHCYWQSGDLDKAIGEMERFRDMGGEESDYDALDAWVQAWGDKRAAHDFSDLHPFADEEDDTNVVTEGAPPTGEEEVPHGA
jgi:tetratricopeptide (TPR) repeat protein